MATKAQDRAAIRKSVSAAWNRGDEAKVIRSVIAKYAKIIDECESARDMKPLASGMFEAIDRLKMLEAREQSKSAPNALSVIMNMSDLARPAQQDERKAL